jgi:hypothetical protein
MAATVAADQVFSHAHILLTAGITAALTWAPQRGGWAAEPSPTRPGSP